MGVSEKQIDILEVLKNEFISCEKQAIKRNRKSKDALILKLELQHNCKILLRSEYTDPKYYFELELETRGLQEYQKDYYFKLQLHKHDTSTGLLRVEYGLTARHTNLKFKEGMPEFLKEFENTTCEEGVPHVHFCIEDFPDEELLWAIPLDRVRNIRINTISNDNDEIEAINEFFRIANILTEFNLNPEIFSAN